MSDTQIGGIFGCRGIDISFGGRPVLKNVELHVGNHEVLGLVGPNGAGKTSLFEVLCGRYKPTAGQVFLQGEEITGLSVHDRARKGLARTYQSPVVPTAMTVSEVLRAARFSHKPYLTRFDAEWGCHLAHFHTSWDTYAGENVSAKVSHGSGGIVLLRAE